MTQKNKTMNRRGFFNRAAALGVGAMAFPALVPASALGRGGRTSPSERITMGFIGVGKQGTSPLLRSFLEFPQVQVLAVCDVDSLKRERGRKMADDHYARVSEKDYRGCAESGDFLELIHRDDIDAVCIATPDHWHAIMAIQAANAGKDIYCEKPLSLTIEEARAMVNATRQNGRVFQTGSMQRSDRLFRFSCELARNGYIGKIKRVIANVGGPSMECLLPAMETPEYLDWDRWLGPAPWRPYHSELSPHISNNIYPHWREYRDYSGGGMTDWGAHHFDIAQWGLGRDESGPVEIILPKDPSGITELIYVYDDGIELHRAKAQGRSGVTFEGTEGTIFVDRHMMETTPESLMTQKLKANDIRLYDSRDHYADFLQAVQSRRKPICDVEIGCRSVTVCHLGNIAYQLGRSLKWDPVKEEFLNDAEADRLRSRPMRSPWTL